MKLDLKIGDYVRTKYGISKIEKIEDDKTHKTTWYTVDKAQYHSFLVREQEIIKASDKLIDLVDVGDYVNGKKVIEKWEEPFGEFVGQIFIKLEGEETIPTLRNIETIVTKEQFEQISYKVGD